MGCASGVPMRRPSLLSVLSIALLAACGGGAGTGGPADLSFNVGTLAVTTSALPRADAGSSYGPVALRCDAHDPLVVTWTLHAGALPNGVSLGPDGVLYGTPTESGVFVFTVHVGDGVRGATRRLALAVDAFGVFVQSGLVAGDAWTDRPLEIRAVGQTGAVTFSLDTAADADLSLVDENAGTATLVVRGGDEVVVFAEDAAGHATRLDVTVRSDPTSGFQAEFAVSDVWYVNDMHKFGAHPYATDLHAALVDVGLRDPASTDDVGTEADELAVRYVRIQMLRELNRLFLREGDGSAGANGLAISFPYHRPTGAMRPLPGSTLAGGALRYNEIGLGWGTRPLVVGTAVIDGPHNGLLENNTSGTQNGEFGLFVNVISEFFLASFRPDELRNEPVDSNDIPALRALIHGASNPGGRYAALKYFGGGFARVLATICAHEIGHSLGLVHADGIMASESNLSPTNWPAFSSGDVERLRIALPGPGRTSTSASKASALPEGGITVCGCPGH